MSNEVKPPEAPKPDVRALALKAGYALALLVLMVFASYFGLPVCWDCLKMLLP